MKKLFLTILGTLLLISCSSDNSTTSTNSTNNQTNTISNFDLELGIESYETILIEKIEIRQVSLADNTKLIITPNSKEFTYFFLTNNIDSKGSGSLSISTKNDYFHQDYKNFQRLANLQKNAFRECMDEMYNRICDNFVGCVVWHTDPRVPLVAALYCQATLQKFLTKDNEIPNFTIDKMSSNSELATNILLEQNLKMIKADLKNHIKLQNKTN